VREVARAVRTNERGGGDKRSSPWVPTLKLRWLPSPLVVGVTAAAIARHVPGTDGGQRRAAATSRFQRLSTYVRCPTGIRQPPRHQYNFLAIILV